MVWIVVSLGVEVFVTFDLRREVRDMYVTSVVSVVHCEIEDVKIFGEDFVERFVFVFRIVTM